LKKSSIRKEQYNQLSPFCDFHLQNTKFTDPLTPYHGLPEDYSCGIYEQRPGVCVDFRAEELVCGSSRQEAIAILSRLENESGSRQ